MIRADDLNVLLPDEVFDLEHRLPHPDAKCPSFVAARDDAAVVRRQDDGGAAFKTGAEYPFAGDEEVIAIDQAVYSHGRSRTSPLTTPHTHASSRSRAEKGRTDNSPSITATTMDRGPGVRERSHDQDVAGTNSLLVHAIAFDRDKECGRGAFDEMFIEAQACGSGDYGKHRDRPY